MRPATAVCCVVLALAVLLLAVGPGTVSALSHCDHDAIIAAVQEIIPANNNNDDDDDGGGQDDDDDGNGGGGRGRRLSQAGGTRGDVIGGLVRLSFHDAGTWSQSEGNGGPDGCLLFDDPDNGGITDIVAGIESIYAEWSDRISRADFWALAANAAIVEATPGGAIAEVPFRFGRVDAASCDYDVGRLPDSEQGYNHVMSWAVDQLGLTMRDVVALMGAHTLGRTEPANSGYDGPWVNQDAVFDNQYYDDMINDPWDHEQNDFTDLGIGRLTHQWNRGGRMMLNTDMALGFDIGADDPNARNQPRCGGNNNQCSINVPTRPIVEEFAESNQAFYEAFLQAWVKMQELGVESSLQSLTQETCTGVTLISPSPTISPVVSSPPPTQPATSTATSGDAVLNVCDYNDMIAAVRAQIPANNNNDDDDDGGGQDDDDDGNGGGGRGRRLSQAGGTRGDVIGGLVRLSFHDAGTWSQSEGNGGPDGCLLFDDPDNGGITDIVAGIESIYAEWSDRISRADFWALAANAAIVEATPGGAIAEVPFRFGRVDAASCDYDVGRLPDSEQGYNHVMSWAVDQLGLTMRDVVALMGAHTLGRTEPANSGYDGPWVNQDAVFDNQYYDDMINDPWDHEQNDFTDLGIGRLTHQWNRGGRMMLNTDMALGFDIGADDPNARNQPRCGGNNNQCSINVPTRPIVEEFAESNQAFYEAFLQAWVKMQELGVESSLQSVMQDCSIPSIPAGRDAGSSSPSESLNPPPTPPSPAIIPSPSPPPPGSPPQPSSPSPSPPPPISSPSPPPPTVSPPPPATPTNPPPPTSPGSPPPPSTPNSPPPPGPSSPAPPPPATPSDPGTAFTQETVALTTLFSSLDASIIENEVELNAFINLLLDALMEFALAIMADARQGEVPPGDEEGPVIRITSIAAGSVVVGTEVIFPSVRSETASNTGELFRSTLESEPADFVFANSPDLLALAPVTVDVALTVETTASPGPDTVETPAPEPAPALDTPNSPWGMPVIIGAAVGGVVLLAGVAALVYMYATFHRRCRVAAADAEKARKAQEELEAKKQGKAELWHSSSSFDDIEASGLKAHV